MKGTVFVLLLYFLIVAFQNQEPETIKTDRINGVLCTNNEDWLPYLNKKATPWTPSKSQIVLTEENLELYLKNGSHYPYWKKAERHSFWKKMANYNRQYLGFIYKGRKKIYGNFYCDKTPLACIPVDVDDGGDCYIRVIFDVRSKKIDLFLKNGKA